MLGVFLRPCERSMSRFSIAGGGGSAPDEYVPVNNHNEVPELESRIDLVASGSPENPDR